MIELEETEPAKPTRAEGRRAGVHRFLETCMAEMNRLGGIPSPREAREMWGDIWLQETHHSTGIEGNKLSYTEVEAMLRDHREVAPDQHHDYLEISGYAEAAQWVYSHAIQPEGWATDDLITLSEIRYIHEVAMAQVWAQYPHPDASEDERPGSFRRHDIKAFSGGMEPPSWPDVPNMLATWVDGVNAIHEGEGHILERVAQTHTDFEHIHPFLDGNGRTGRLILNLLLVRLGYPPAIIVRTRRKMYLEALGACDAGDPGPLGETIASAVINTMKLTVFPCITGPGRYVLLSVLADEKCTAAKLRQAAIKGKLQAEKDEDGFWRSTPKFVGEYRASLGT